MLIGPERINGRYHECMPADRCDLLCLDLPRAEALRQHRRSLGRLDGAASRARALADPTRLAVASALNEGGELCVCDLSWIVERSQNLVSHHLRTLRAVGLVRLRRDGKLAMYDLTDGGRALLGAVLDMSEAPA
jgi:DNA-binding transcriptional ArsR family regulator